MQFTLNCSGIREVPQLQLTKVTLIMKMALKLQNVLFQIRKQAIKDLPSFCKGHKEHTQRISDILAQLLQSEDPTEISIVQNSLLAILKNDPKGTLSGLFSQIHQCTESESANDVVREKCIKFLSTKIKQLGREVIDKDTEDLIVTECKKILEVGG